MFDNIDLNDFWDNNEEHEKLNPEPFSEETLRETEEKIGYKYPESYIALMRVQNGGCPQKPRVGDTGWVINEIYGIGKDGIDEYILCTESGCPNDFVPVCSDEDGFCRICLDYRMCGNDGEPRVVGVGFESKTISFLAKNFESFINMLIPEDDEDDEENETAEDKYDPYEGVQFTPVEGELKKELNRAIWGDLPWAIGFAAFFLLLIFLLRSSKNALLIMIRILSYFPAGYGILGTIAGFIDCVSKTKKTYDSYIDTVDVVWEANEPLNKPKNDDKKKKFFLRLKNSKVEMYPNTDGFKEGDRVRVYRPKSKGETILVKQKDQ